MKPLVVTIPMRTMNPTNGATGNSRTAGIIRARRRRKQREAVHFALCYDKRGLPRPISIADLPVLVTITRVAPSSGLDEHDGLRPALKSVVDGVADWLGLESDRDERVTWAYDQQRGRRGEYAVVIRIEPREQTQSEWAFAQQAPTKARRK